MSISFRPVRRVKIFQDVVTQIKAAVLSGRLNPGQKLPSERSLQTMFNASRPTIREAVRVLENSGLIRVKPGKNGGMFIRSGPFNPLKDQFALLTSSGRFSLDHIAEFRSHLESQVVEAAMERVEYKDICDLETIVNAAHDHLINQSGSIRKFLEDDMAFHLKLSRISGDTLSVYILDAIYNLTRHYERFCRLEIRVLEESLQDLCDILTAFSNHRSAETKALLKNHIRKFNSMTA